MSQTDWQELAELSLRRARSAGGEYADIRLLESTWEIVRGQDRRIATIQDIRDSGFGVRVLYHGAWGFAASSVISPEELPHVTDLALEIAKGSATLMREPVRLAPEPPHTDSIATPYGRDPFAVPLEEKTRLLQETMERLHRQPGIARSSASLWARRDRKFFASTEGARIHFDLLAVQGECEATAVHDGSFASRSFNTPHLRAGYEVITDARFLDAAPRVAAQAMEKVLAPPVEPGRYDLVLDPEHLSLTIHESCGHPSELDRALGYEANYAGTSFLTPDKRGWFRYGSPHVTMVADNTEPETLAATGYDDDGVACQRWDIIREGIFVDYCTSRELATKIEAKRSRGSNRADGWGSIPMVRIANIGLEPGAGRVDDMIGDVRRGIYIEGHGSFSIDSNDTTFSSGAMPFG